MLCWKESSAVLGPAALEMSNTTKPRICKLFRLSYTKPLQKRERKKAHFLQPIFTGYTEVEKKDSDLRLLSISSSL